MTPREQLEAAIERAIAVLDAMDPDAESEAEAAESSHDEEPIDYAA